MTNVNEIITESLWNDVETWFDGIGAMLSHRCYQPRSMAGIRAIQRDVRKHLVWIDDMLLEIEVLAAKAAKHEVQCFTVGHSRIGDGSVIRGDDE